MATGFGSWVHMVAIDVVVMIRYILLVYFSYILLEEHFVFISDILVQSGRLYFTNS